MADTQAHPQACAEALREAEESVHRASNALWSPHSRPVGAEVLDRAAALTDGMNRLTVEFCGHLPASSRREHADALEWVGQRYQEAAHGLRAIRRSLAGQEPSQPLRGPVRLASGGTLTPGPERVVLTLGMLQELARARFGGDPQRWRFVCPVCGSETAVGDFAEFGPDSAPGQECIGRYDKTQGCDHAAYGLIPLAPWIVGLPSGKNILSFALADPSPEAKTGPDQDSNAGQEVPHEGESAADVAGS